MRLIHPYLCYIFVRDKKDNNLNNTLDTSLEHNFNAALKLCEQQYSYDELLTLLGSDKIFEKQIAVLSLNEIKSFEDAMILVSNLVGQDGKIREAVAFKINELIINPTFSQYFENENIFEFFFEGIMDINGNVCRQIIDCTTNEKFNKYLGERLPDKIRQILAKIADLSAEEKQFVISKRNFQLYWALEALYNCIENINTELIADILKETAEFEDYTIREKVAKILSKLNVQEFLDLKNKLGADENYYVRRYLQAQ